jgi:hypothetical protein
LQIILLIRYARDDNEFGDWEQYVNRVHARLTLFMVRINVEARGNGAAEEESNRD